MIVPVLSKVTRSTDANFSKPSPDFINIPCLVAFPIAAIMAVGVAKTSAQGQKTTRIVTARKISFVTSQVTIAVLKEATTIHVAHLSAVRTIGVLSVSADSTN